MVTEAKDRQVNTALPAKSDDGKRLPHERDESPDGHQQKTRSVIRQAASDLEQGLVDTDMHGIRGVEKVQPQPPGTAAPQPGNKRD
ncbi:hypothetical protein GCM10027277_15250 [Pseudoduganella ginsengisoli]|uniref:Uncharacterized protein n=1 Tax=Pseudoduganella ginsengisoli TaxID=1462440 RepID=A0A6L6PVT0_9BURK|nr:hypothetical protein [Pseudoduganella ginsengisoli]MTW01214.1 hypothetical protein [Pseudoduganella ginsengisoli]